MVITSYLTHPDILQKLIVEYNKYAQDAGVVIPRGEKFDE